MDSPQSVTEVAYIGLGSNIEDREFHLTEAIRLLQQYANIHISRSSSIYETDPVGFTEQAAFLNMVIQVETDLGPADLFNCMLAVEQQLGRVRDIRWGPRTIDLDLLLYGQLLSNEPELIIPHPRMAERAFVLIPLLEIADDETILDLDKLKHHAKLLAGKEVVRRWNMPSNLHEE